MTPRCRRSLAAWSPGFHLCPRWRYLPADDARAIRVQDQGIDALLASMTALGEERLRGDHPAIYWVSEWRWLENLRELYADELEAGEKPMVTIPVIGGYPITHRMRTPVACPVVKTLGAPLMPERHPRLQGQVVPARWTDGVQRRLPRSAGARSG